MTFAHFFQSSIRKQLIKAYSLSAVGVLYVLSDTSSACVLN
ncbi:hypothetical protein [Rubritalea tangerina]